jgi:hypothetical protein
MKDTGSTRPRIDKLGVKREHDVLLLGIEDDETFLAELNERGARVRTRGKQPADLVFATFRHRNDLRRLASLVARLKSDGALWTLRPKGSKDLTERDMMQAGQQAGLVDVKVVSFSPELTAEKFVIPVAKRAAHRPAAAALRTRESSPSRDRI